MAVRGGDGRQRSARPLALEVGMPAPPLCLPALDGRQTDLAALRGRAVLVVFLRHAG